MYKQPYRCVQEDGNILKEYWCIIDSHEWWISQKVAILYFNNILNLLELDKVFSINFKTGKVQEYLERSLEEIRFQIS